MLALAPAAVIAGMTTLSPTGLGDVETGYTDVTYTLDANPNTGTLTAIGYPENLKVGGQNIVNGSFDLSVTLRRSDGALLGGTVDISGTTDPIPTFSGTLLQGNITWFNAYFPPGFVSGPGPIFEFKFDVTGGALQAPYYSSNHGGMILGLKEFQPALSPPGGPFTANFANYYPFINSPASGLLAVNFASSTNSGPQGFGYSDTFPLPVPEPSSLILLSLGLVTLAWHNKLIRRRA